MAEVYQSSEEPQTLVVRTVTGMRKINLNWYDVLLMLYRTSLLTLQKVEGTGVIFFGERTEERRKYGSLCDEVDCRAILATASTRRKIS